MPKSVARSKTRKAVAKRFKITPVASLENAFLATPSDVDRKTRSASAGWPSHARVDRTDVAEVKAIFRSA
jgi:ribosomal protein L35